MRKTMITDKQRRVVAERMREHSGAKLFTGDDVERLIGAEPSGFRPKDADTNYNLLADLIDRPTCKRVHMDATGRPPFYTGGIALNYVVGGCSECGYPFGNGNAIIGNPFSAPNYCPNCGARVVTDDD